MNVQQLIDRLKEYPPNREVYIDSGFSAFGIVKQGTVYTAFLKPDQDKFLPDDYFTLSDPRSCLQKNPVVMLSL